MKRAMVFAAGLGTRLKPITDSIPKALVEVGGKTLLEITLERLKNEGFNFVVVNVHHFADKVKAYLLCNDNFGMDIHISDESDCLLDTGGAIKKAYTLFKGEPFLIHNVDILSNAKLGELYDWHIQKNNTASLLVSNRNSSRKLMFDMDGRLCGWRNLNTGETKLPWGDNTPNITMESAFSGIHVFSPSLAEQMTGYPDKFSIIDFYLATCGNYAIKGFNDEHLTLNDVGKIDQLQEAETFLRSLE